jgi:hypothetical protein
LVEQAPDLFRSFADFWVLDGMTNDEAELVFFRIRFGRLTLV